jgi:hypothetical protein
VPDHIADREEILSFLRYELVGPWESWTEGAPSIVPRGEELDFSSGVTFPDLQASYGPWVQESTREEVLQRDRPIKRYGVGVLYPMGVPLEANADVDEDAPTEVDSLDSLEEGVETISTQGEDDIRRIAESRRFDRSEDDDFELTGANGLRPSTMAVSFRAELPEGTTLVVEARGGRYTPTRVQIDGRDRTWWLRTPIRLRAAFRREELLLDRDALVRPEPDALTTENLDDLNVEISAYTRPKGDELSLLTVSLTNRTLEPVTGGPDRACIFQARFSAGVFRGDERVDAILPYPTAARAEDAVVDLEQESFDLLYRGMKTFAVGHGTAADWDGPAEQRVDEVRAEPLPVVETPSITPELRVEGTDNELVRVPMGPLAGLDDDNDGMAAVERVIQLYEEWLETEQKPKARNLDPVYQAAADRHMEDCERALARMRRGLEFLRENARAMTAFRLANEAILLQQLRTRRTARPTTMVGGRFTVDEPPPSVDWRSAVDRGSWRPFQVAFLLCALESVADPHADERETVELIWFPTGGGKTEAYLGLSAFSLFYRRLVDPEDQGVEVLMRYTLRLLTQQQFQRAASLICAMEVIRKREQSRGEIALGAGEFSIGIWLGGDSTPNRRDDARRILRALNRGDDVENRFVILRCPWCSAQMGPIPRANVLGRAPRNTLRVAGYVQDDSSVAFFCPDQQCDFSARLPIYVVDEDIYDIRPSIVIGTVDKFARLAWDPQCRAIFGLAEDGSRFASPPQTVIQDELHLISGPLGSMVGLYEAIIERLCTDLRSEVPVRPKIISSTATIRRHEQQIRSLYARDDVALFPPRALDAADSFFARFATNPDGSLARGRTYVGVHAPGLGSVQTAQVRTFSALLQAPTEFDDEGRDPWWTLMVFFNSLRELGTSLSLLQSDIPDYLKVLRNRFSLKPNEVRRLRNVMELTGRLGNDQVPKSMEALSQPAGPDSVDICLASNIIEVGIDIDRLSLMTIVGQPKTTSQYIQVTGRVGRQWWSRPALVTTILSPTKPRDRSHYEKFRSYHERLYAQVEPTSVTPFSPPVLDRALHAALCAFVRQSGDAAVPPWPVPEQLIDEARDLLSERVAFVDPDEAASLDEIFEQRRSEWQRWQRRIWQSWGADEEIPLLRRAGEYATRAAMQVSWSTPTSLRNVDAECRAEVSLGYVQEEPSDV